MELAKKLRKRRMKQEQLGKRIQDAYEQGAVSMGDFEFFTGKSRRLIQDNSTYKAGIPSVKERRRNALLQGIAQGVTSRAQLARMMSVPKRAAVYAYAKEEGISLAEDLEPCPYRPEYDSLIQGGEPLQTIANTTGNTVENARLYINYSGQHKYWKEQKQRKKQHKANLVGSVSQLLGILSQAANIQARKLAEQDGEAGTNAINYIEQRKYAHRPNDYTYLEIKKVLTNYQQAETQGKTLTLEQIARGTGATAMGARKILRCSGLTPLNGTRISQLAYRGEKKEAVLRGVTLPFAATDIAHFLDLPSNLPCLRYLAEGIQRKNVHRGLVKINQNNQEQVQPFTYKLASQIYEARALGFTPQQTSELYEQPQRIIDRALKHKEHVQPQIIQGLRTLYDDATISKPYVTERMRKRLEKKEGRKK